MSSPSALFPPTPESGPNSFTVTALRESPRAPGRYAVTLNDGRSFIVGVAALADTGATRIGAQLDLVAVERLTREATVSDLVARAVDLLARGRKTKRELELRLRRREPDRSLVALAIERLESAGLIVDTEVAAAEAASRLRRGVAPARVRQTLRSKGIGGRDADQAIANAVAEEGFDEIAACRAAAEKRMRSLQSLDPVVARRRLLGFLQRRGFGGAALRSVLDELGRMPDDP